MMSLMKLGNLSQTAIGWIAVICAVPLITLLMLRIGTDASAAGLLYILIVVAATARAGSRAAMLTSVVCALLFDFYFLPPTGTLFVGGAHELIALGAFLLCSFVVGRVAEQASRQAALNDQRRQDVERLYALSQEMMLYEDGSRLLRELPRMIDRIFALDGVVLYVADQDRFYSSSAEMPMSIQASLRAMSFGHNPTLVVPGGITARALTLGLRTVGALGWRPSTLSREVSTAISAQVAIALTRASATEATARIEAARESERLRTALIDSLTHELRTPLTSIRAAATTLVECGGDELTSELAAVVDEEASRLDALIGEAIEMAQIDAHVVKVQLAPIMQRALLEQAADTSRAALAGHPVVYDIEGDDAPVWLDAHLLGRVFRHLLENAARHTPSGGRILLRTRRKGQRVEFAVEDSGTGIDAADLPFIFDKFYRGKGAQNTGKKKGTGMGLAIVRAILKAHGGSIEVVSQPGHGAAFRFWVPLLERDPQS